MKTLFLILSILSFININAQLTPTETQALVKVLVTTKTGIPQIGEKVHITKISDKSILEFISDTAGRFEVLLNKGEEYQIDVITFGDNDSPSVFKVPNPEGNVVLNYTIYTTTINTFNLDIVFETGKAELLIHSYSALDDFYNLLDSKKDMKVEIGGHTDNVGNDTDNLILSEKRANVVKDYLIKKGIEQSRITAKGYGESKPLESNDTPEGRQKNRRTEVTIIQQ